MNAAIATASISPLFRGACDVPALTEASKQAFIYKGLHGNLWVNQREIHQNPSSVKRQSGITAPVGRFYSVCRLTAART